PRARERRWLRLTLGADQLTLVLFQRHSRKKCEVRAFFKELVLKYLPKTIFTFVVLENFLSAAPELQQ
ncbi:MAG: hypothetical protein ACU0C9_08355, partial [Paracoccaceae bacterium]